MHSVAPDSFLRHWSEDAPRLVTSDKSDSTALARVDCSVELKTLLTQEASWKYVASTLSSYILVKALEDQGWRGRQDVPEEVKMTVRDKYTCTLTVEYQHPHGYVDFVVSLYRASQDTNKIH